MAFFLNKSTLASHFRSTSQQKIEDPVSLSRRQFHVEPGTREKALLAEDSALKPFKSYKQSVKKLRKIGDVLTIVVVAGRLRVVNAWRKFKIANINVPASEHKEECDLSNIPLAGLGDSLRLDLAISNVERHRPLSLPCTELRRSMSPREIWGELLQIGSVEEKQFILPIQPTIVSSNQHPDPSFCGYPSSF
ncbi:hypothetical protein RYX36_015335 [Vicia faba]